MYKFLIAQYINKLSIEDVNNFAIKNNIYLEKNELDIIFKTLKNNWETILYHNPKPIFDNLKTKLNPNSYQKGLVLYQTYYEMYKNYL